MSVAFELSVVRSRLVTAAVGAAHLLAGLGVAVAVVHASGLAGSLVVPVAAIAVAVVSMLGWSVHRVRRLGAGRLSVSADGRAFWSAAPASGVRVAGDPDAMPVRIERFYVGRHFAWVALRVADCASEAVLPRPPASRVDLLIGSDRAGADDWRALRAWLTWSERGLQA